LLKVVFTFAFNRLDAEVHMVLCSPASLFSLFVKGIGVRNTTDQTIKSSLSYL